jgi:hypothetical protein
MTQQDASRKPARLVKEKPIALRLTQDELADAERIAAQEGMSKSAHGRKCYLLGKSILYPSSPQPATKPVPRKRVTRGSGGRSSAPRSSSR